MKVIIAGSRTIDDYEYVKSCIERTLINLKITEIFSGGAKGVDALGERYARLNKIPLMRFVANWKLAGKKAGILRNKVMAVHADALIAVWDGRSKGTAHMIECMRKLKKPVFVYKGKV